MVADLDLLLIAVFCTADDLLPKRAANARRRITDAEVVTLCIAQAMLGIASDERFLALAGHRLAHLFPQLPERTAYHKRRLRLAGAIEALIAEFARHSPGFYDDLALVDSTPVECARSVETTRRSQLADAADYGYCASHSRFFWGFRLHALFALDGTPRALALTSPKVDEKTVCLQLVARCERQPGQMLILIGDKNFRGQGFEADLALLDATIHRPRRKDEPGRGPHLAPIGQRIESIFWTAKDILGLERHGARTLHNLFVPIAMRFAALAAAVALNHRLGRRSVDTNNLGATRILRAFDPILRRGGRLLVVASDFGSLRGCAHLHERFDTDATSLDDVDTTMLAWRDAVMEARAAEERWPEWTDIPSKVGQVAAVRVLARERRAADRTDGTLVGRDLPRVGGHGGVAPVV